MAQAQVQELTQEQILIQRLIEEAREDLQRLDVSKKARIQRLAEDLDSTGVIPTNMISDLIANKLRDCAGCTRAYITEVLDSKYKNQNLARTSKQNTSTRSSVTSSSQTTVSFAKSTSEQTASIPFSVYDNYASSKSNLFDIRDCSIEAWDSYTDGIKKQWVLQLIEDKRELERNIMDLHERIAKLTIYR